MGYYLFNGDLYHIDELWHHGVKGQRKGVHNGPPYPINRIRYGKSKMIKNMLDSGKIKSKIDPKKQSKHIKGSDYKSGKSYIYGNEQTAQQLVNKLAGTGLLIKDRHGNWTNKERVINNAPIGVSISNKTGKSIETNEATIHYSKTGTHIVPRGKKNGR